MKSFLIRKAKQQRIDNENGKAHLLEHYFADFAHLLAHHPDFSLEKSDLELFEIYIKFFLDCIATADNISYLYCISAQLKTVKDKFLEDSISLYILSELTQVLIREQCAQNNWILQTYPGKIGIPKDLFERLPANKSAEIMKTIFLETKSNYMKGRNGKSKSIVKKEPRKRKTSSGLDSDSDSTQVENVSNTPLKKVQSSTPLRKSSRKNQVKRSYLIESNSEYED